MNLYHLLVLIFVISQGILILTALGAKDPGMATVLCFNIALLALAFSMRST